MTYYYKQLHLECGEEKEGNKNLEVTVCSSIYVGTETTGKCKIFQVCGQHDNKWYKIYT
jgi:hypothetical protein